MDLTVEMRVMTPPIIRATTLESTSRSRKSTAAKDNYMWIVAGEKCQYHRSKNKTDKAEMANSLVKTQEILASAVQENW